MYWQTTKHRIDLTHTRVMGIVNVTPDSFADGGRTVQAAAALARCERLVEEGADILDIGGESTRPGAIPPGEQQECDRVLPVIEGALRLGVPVSVDTSALMVVRAALAAGVDIVNDVRALTRPGVLAAVAGEGRVGVCLMHLRGEPDTMAGLAGYGDVVAEVGDFLAGRAAQVEAAGVARARIAIDPGIGFAKTAADNLALLARQQELVGRGWPVLVGWSRKQTLGLITGRSVEDRMVASVAAALLAVQRGAAVVRVHDVAATVDALKVWRALPPVGLAGQRPGAV
jgi:dihydropteroate synthase